MRDSPIQRAAQAAPDLTVEELACLFRRRPSAVRGWRGCGKLRGYKLNGRDRRVTRQAIREYEAAQGEAGRDSGPAIPDGAFPYANPG